MSTYFKISEKTSARLYYLERTKYYKFLESLFATLNITKFLKFSLLLNFIKFCIFLVLSIFVKFKSFLIITNFKVCQPTNLCNFIVDLFYFFKMNQIILIWVEGLLFCAK